MLLLQPLNNVGTIATIFTNKLKAVKLLIILIIGLAMVLYIIDFSTSRLSHFKFSLPFNDNDEDDLKWNWKFVQEFDQENRESHQSYFVNAEGCRMPSFKMIDSNVEKFLFISKAVDCGKSLTRSNNNYLWIDLNETEIQLKYGINNVNDLHCEYEPFIRKNDFKNEYPTTNRKMRLRFGDFLKVMDEYIRVICRITGRKKEIYRDYHYFVQAKKSKENFINQNERKKEQNMSIMVIGLDSVSRLNFHRRMNESAAVLLNDLQAIELFGFNKVADNTYPNLIPMLTGLDEDELITACIPTKNHTFDRCHFIWDEFKEKNYFTAYAEDMGSLGLFQYLRRGFKEQPTDYCLRPIIIEMEHNTAKQKSVNTYLCMGNRRTVDILLDYAQKFITFMTTKATRPHFSFFWTTSYTHDYLNFPTLIDADFANFLRNLKLSGALNNTFLVLMSDHGIRWGSFRNTYQGFMEERQPFLYFVAPKWFPEMYPAAMRNLVRNGRRLTTHFDLYEILRDLSNLKSLETPNIKRRTKELRETEPMPRGISLFLPIPTTRSCHDAAIGPHWCTCHDKIELSATEPRVSQVARLIVNHINEMIKIHRDCQRLRLNSVLSANLLSNANFRNVTNQFVDITVRLQTRPGYGEFEATVRVYENHDLELTGTISRTNLYGIQSYCIDDSKLKLYCFCDSLM